MWSSDIRFLAEESLGKPLLIVIPDSVCTHLVVAMMMATVASEGAVGYFGAPEEACLHSPTLLSLA